MEPQVNILMVEGTLEEQIIEMARCIDIRKGTQDLEPRVQKLVEQVQQEAALEVVVSNSGVLIQSPEREFIPNYNLLIQLVRSSDKLSAHITALLRNLSTPPQTSPAANGAALAISVLSTLYNVLPSNSSERYRIFRTMLKVIAENNLYELLQPQLKNVEKWVSEWNIRVEEARELYEAIARAASAAHEQEQAYNFFIKSLQTFSEQEAITPKARDLAATLVKMSINIPSRLDFDELSSYPAVAHLQDSDPELFQLFDVFAGGQLDDYIEFNDEHEGWVDDNGIDHTVAYRKIRLLTLTSLAASFPDRSLPYNIISRRLHVPEEEVELWVIDVIRAGLVEGKLSQLNQTFLIHRANSRSFGRDEWKEVAARLGVWRQSLQGILGVIRAGREQAKLAEVRDQQKIEQQLSGIGGRRDRQQQLEIEG